MSPEHGIAADAPIGSLFVSPDLVYQKTDFSDWLYIGGLAADSVGLYRATDYGIASMTNGTQDWWIF